MKKIMLMSIFVFSVSFFKVPLHAFPISKETDRQEIMYDIVTLNNGSCELRHQHMPGDSLFWDLVPNLLEQYNNERKAWNQKNCTSATQDERAHPVTHKELQKRYQKLIRTYLFSGALIGATSLLSSIRAYSLSYTLGSAALAAGNAICAAGAYYYTDKVVENL